jgi:hypothetical protein
MPELYLKCAAPGLSRSAMRLLEVQPAAHEGAQRHEHDHQPNDNDHHEDTQNLPGRRSLWNARPLIVKVDMGYLTRLSPSLSAVHRCSHIRIHPGSFLAQCFHISPRRGAYPQPLSPRRVMEQKIFGFLVLSAWCQQECVVMTVVSAFPDDLSVIIDAYRLIQNPAGRGRNQIGQPVTFPGTPQASTCV